jgi:hypothetical protein
MGLLRPSAAVKKLQPLPLKIPGVTWSKWEGSSLGRGRVSACSEGEVRCLKIHRTCKLRGEVWLGNQTHTARQPSWIGGHMQVRE